MTGGELQQGIIEAAMWRGWYVFHTALVGAHKRKVMCPKCLHWFFLKLRGQLRGNGEGYPDLTLAHPVCGHAFVECKGEDEPLRPKQKEWLNVLAGSTERVAVWRPKHYDAALEWLQHPGMEIPGRWKTPEV